MQMNFSSSLTSLGLGDEGEEAPLLPLPPQGKLWPCHCLCLSFPCRTPNPPSSLTLLVFKGLSPPSTALISCTIDPKSTWRPKFSRQWWGHPELLCTPKPWKRAGTHSTFLLWPAPTPALHLSPRTSRRADFWEVSLNAKKPTRGRILLKERGGDCPKV